MDLVDTVTGTYAGGGQTSTAAAEHQRFAAGNPTLLGRAAATGVIPLTRSSTASSTRLPRSLSRWFCCCSCSRAVVVPLLALACSALSLTATFGALAFGLAMDYQVFLRSRMREEYERTGDNVGRGSIRAAVVSRIVTAAAVLMSIVLLASLSPSSRSSSCSVSACRRPWRWTPR